MFMHFKRFTQTIKYFLVFEFYGNLVGVMGEFRYSFVIIYMMMITIIQIWRQRLVFLVSCRQRVSGKIITEIDKPI